MQIHAAIPKAAWVAAVVLAICAGGWREERPVRIGRHRGVGNAHVLWGVGFSLPKTTVALALGGDALFWFDDGLAKWA